MGEGAMFLRSSSEGKKLNKNLKQWKTVRELWDIASSAEVELERAGKKVTLQEVWNTIKQFAPDDLQGELESSFVPKWVVEALDHPGYRQLVDLRKRMIVLPMLKELGVMRELTGQGAMLALSSALEDLLLRPEKISTSEKRQLAKTFTEMNIRLKGAKIEGEGNETGTGDIDRKSVV
jgi:hypothetical protein